MKDIDSIVSEILAEKRIPGLSVGVVKDGETDLLKDMDLQI